MFDPVYFVPMSEKAMAITFDDGPEPGVTDVLLATLAKHGAKATFFMIGEQVRKHPELAKRVVDEGHEVGIHSHKHQKGMRFWDEKELIEDFSDAIKAVQDATGVRPASIRTPFGNLSRPIIHACEKTDLKYVGWSLSVMDWRGRKRGKGEKLVAMSLPGSIVLFHDGGRVDKDRVCVTNELLCDLLEGKRGYDFVSVASLVEKWDEKAVSLVNGMRLLGCTSRYTGECVEGVAFWHPDDVIKGISYSLTLNGKSEASGTVVIPTMSNVTDWCAPALIRSEVPDAASVASAKAYLEDSREVVMANLGCGEHILPQWDNFDIPEKAGGAVQAWKWNQKLPYNDGAVSVVLIQHCTNHCVYEDFDWNMKEIFRALKPGGKIIVKDADDRHYVWKQIGSHKDGGIILSTMSEPKMTDVLKKAGFVNIETNKDMLAEKHRSILTRADRLVRGDKFFIVEGMKPLV